MNFRTVIPALAILISNQAWASSAFECKAWLLNGVEDWVQRPS